MTRVNFTLCPFCGYEHDRASAVTRRGARPDVEPRMKPGDATLCIRCGGFGVMGDDDMLRKPTPAEAHDLDRDPAVRTMREAWQQALGSKRRV